VLAQYLYVPTSTLDPTFNPETIVKVAYWVGMSETQIFNYLRSGTEVLGESRVFKTREGRTDRTNGIIS